MRYNNACNAYLKAFCEKHGFSYENAVDFWVANDVGSICMLGDYFVSFDDMKTDIDMDADKNQYWSYYDYMMESQDLGFKCPNYANWLRGCPRLSEGRIKSLREAKNRVYEAQRNFKLAIEAANDEITGGGIMT